MASGGERLVYSGGVIKTQIWVFRFDGDRGGEPEISTLDVGMSLM